MKEKTEKKKIRVGSVIFRIVLIIVAGLTVGLAVFSFNAAHIGGNQLPMPFGYGASVVLSGSMEPALAVNDLVFVEARDDYDPGDVVVYQNGNTLIIHRIVKKDGETFVTRGDANNADDDPISLSEIKGAMIFRIPFIGLIFKWLKTLPGTLIVLGLAIFLLYRSRRKERAKDAEQLDEIVEEIRRLQAIRQQNSPDQATPQNAQPGSDDAAEAPDQQQETAVEESVPAESDSKVQAVQDIPVTQDSKEASSEQQEQKEVCDEPASQPDDAADSIAEIDALISEIENDQ